MSDSTMEVRNGHITKEEGLGLIKQFKLIKKKRILQKYHIQKDWNA